MTRKLFRGGTAYVGLRTKNSKMATSVLYVGAVFRASGARRLRRGSIRRICDSVLVVGRRMALGGGDEIIFLIYIMNNQKSYKIIARSKKMRNICGASPAEVAKKVALKLLVKNIYSMYFSIIEIKTNKIIHYQSNKKELARPYHKNETLVKYRIIVKKMGKQVGGTYQPNLEDENDPIFIFFPKERFDISFHNGKKKYRETDYNKIIYIKDLRNNNCLQIVFYTTENNERIFCCIELSRLDKCNNKTSDNLEALKKYAEYLKKNFIDNLRYISLIDVSCIKDNNVYLSLLSILTTGECWYNRFGFK